MLEEQLAVARETYGDNLIAKSPTELTFLVADHGEFDIQLPADYPDSPPHVLRSGQEILTPLTENWIESFTISNVIEQLVILTKNEKRLEFVVTDDEIRGAMESHSAAELRQHQVRQSIVESLPVVKNAKRERAHAEAEAKNARRESDSQADLFARTMQEYQEQHANLALLQAKHDRELANPSARQAYAMRQRLDTIKAELETGAKEIEELKEQFAAKKMTFREYTMRMFEIQKQQATRVVLNEIIDLQMPK